MSTTSSKRGTKTRVYRFLQQSWTQIFTGQIFLELSLKIVYTDSKTDHVIPDCNPVSSLQTGQKIIEIPYNRISRVKLQQNDMKILYLWVDSNPLSFSFLTEQDASLAQQVIALLSEKLHYDDNPQDQAVSLDYIKQTFKDNGVIITTFFFNGKLLAIESIFSGVELLLQEQLTQSQKANIFTIFRTGLKVSDKRVVRKIVENDNYFQTLLRIYSWNPFNKYPFEYLTQYKKLIKISNIIGLKNERILECYQINAKIKYLRDVAACMFIQIQNQRVFQNIINENNLIIFETLNSSTQAFCDLNDLAHTSPESFLNIFSELLQTFKLMNCDYEKRDIKENFMLNFLYHNLHNQAVLSGFSLLKENKINTLSIRFYQRWIEAFNPFLSYNWAFSQQWLISKKSEQSMIVLLYKIFAQSQDQGLKQIIFSFLKWFIEPSDNRQIMERPFIRYVYNQFVSKAWAHVKDSIFLTEIYVQFIMRCYKFETIRTRRVLIEDQVLLQMQKKITTKSILICIIKMLDVFLCCDDTQIFVYLQNHLVFKGLKQQYLRNCGSRNMINSCFMCLLKKIKCVERKEVENYFEEIFLKRGISIL